MFRFISLQKYRSRESNCCECKLKKQTPLSPLKNVKDMDAYSKLITVTNLGAHRTGYLLYSLIL